VTTAALPTARPRVETRDATLPVHPALLQLVVLLWCYALYDILRTSVSGSIGRAITNAAQLTNLERVAGLNVEGTIQRAVLHAPWLVDACNLCYSFTHLLAPPIVLVLLYRRAPAQFRIARNAFLLLLGIALLCFWLFPVAPPRLVPGPTRLADTSQTFSLHAAPFADVIAAKNASTTPTWVGVTNPVAAMPSLHVGWAVWAVLALWPLLRRRATRLLAAAYPAFMALSVIVTGNHWLLDAAAGAALAGLTYAVATRAARRGGAPPALVPARPPAITGGPSTGQATT